MGVEDIGKVRETEGDKGSGNGILYRQVEEEEKEGKG